MLHVLFLWAPLASASEIVAAAWDGIRAEDLGRLYTATFEPTGGSLLAPGTLPVSVPLGDTSREFRKMANSMEVAANAQAWGLFSINAQAGAQTEYGVFRAIEKASLLQVGEENLITTADETAEYYISGIYLGRLYEVNFWGSEASLSAAIEAGMSFQASGGLEGWAKQSSVEYKIRTVGFRERASNTESGLFAKDANEVEARYEATGEPRPILVIFRQIPARFRPAVASPEVKPDIEVISAKSVTVGVGSLKLPRLKSDGGGWDALDGAPDLSVWIKGGGAILYQSPVAEDTYSYNYKTVAIERIDPRNTPSLTITVVDVDFSENDPVARWELSLVSLGWIPREGKEIRLEKEDGVSLVLYLKANSE